MVETPQRLEEFLFEQLAPLYSRVSRTKLRRVLERGLVAINGRSWRYGGRVLARGEKIELRCSIEEVLAERDPRDTPFTMDEAAVVYRDQCLLIVNKPAGLPVEPSRVASRNNLYTLVKEWLGFTNEPLSMPHRLDKETSGLVLFVLDKTYFGWAHDLFANRDVEKIYHALCVGKQVPGLDSVGSVLMVDKPIDRISPASKRAQWGVVSEARPASTEFCVRSLTAKKDGGQRVYEVQAKPKTGRTHQIRVHLAHLGVPIVGDTLYGSKVEAPRVMLHARSLVFVHPQTNKCLDIFAPLPEDYRTTVKTLGITLT